jgi:hypothetical protein
MLVLTFTDRGCHVVRVTDPYDRILGFLDRSRYFFFQAVPHLYSRGWVDLVSDPLLIKSGGAGNWTRSSGSVAKNSDHWTTEKVSGRIAIVILIYHRHKPVYIVYKFLASSAWINAVIVGINVSQLHISMWFKSADSYSSVLCAECWMVRNTTLFSAHLTIVQRHNIIL